MSVRILLIEDDPSFSIEVIGMLRACGGDVEVVHAKSRNAAVAHLQAPDMGFDLALLDLKLPTADEALDADVEHGRHVLSSARKHATGMPLVILTGSPTESFINDFLAHSEQVDVWGDGKKRPTLRFLAKHHLDLLPDYIQPVVLAVRAVRDVEMRPHGQFNLSWCQARLLKVFVRRWGGVSCDVQRISGGLSGADVFRITIYNDVGTTILNSILKIASPKVIQREADNYQSHANRLPEPATARLIGDVRFGGGPLAGIAYRLAARSRSVFEVASDDAMRAATVVQRVSALTADWRRGVIQSRKTIAEVRSRLLNDAKAEDVINKYGLDWARSLEERRVQVHWCCIHGDLHGGNILVDDQDQPILIDYGDVGDGPASLDWVSLELSTLFHPDGCARRGEWPSLEDCRAWPDVAVFSRTSALAPLISACRQISQEAGAGPREIAASAYAYLLRQLSYVDTDKESVLALLEGVRVFIAQDA